MAAGKLPPPGSEFGPCAEPCHHTDCQATRDTAASLCVICGKEIGYSRRFYREECTTVCHALCLEKQQEAAQMKPVAASVGPAS